MILSETWFMEGFIDFELQKYRLLAYLKDVKASFDATKLYPQLSDIVFHYKNLLAFKENKRLLQDNFPRKLGGIDAHNLKMVYEKLISDDEVMAELEEIVEFALDKMKSAIQDGASIFDFVEKKLEVEPVGIVPLYKNEGYVFLHYGNLKQVSIYNYTITLFEHKNARYKGIKLDYIETRDTSLAITYQQIKIEMARLYRTLPNPAVYRVECPFNLPLEETLLPIAKRVLVRHIEAA